VRRLHIGLKQAVSTHPLPFTAESPADREAPWALAERAAG
jgi:hypothetical protein